MSADKSKIDLTIWVVTQEAESAVQKDFPGVKIILVPEGTGFGEMNNKVLKQILGRVQEGWVMLINDDAWVKADWFVKFLVLQKNSPADIYVPIIYEADKKSIDAYGVEYFRSGYAKNNTNLSRPTALFSAACTLIKKQLLVSTTQKYGFVFNEILHFYLEDVELGLRMALSGAVVHKSQDLTAYHQVSATSGRRSRFSMYHVYRNVLWLIIMDWPANVIVKNLGRIGVVQMWVAVFSLIKHGPGLYLGLLWDTLRHWPQLMELRKAIVDDSKSESFEALLTNQTFRTRFGLVI